MVVIFGGDHQGKKQFAKDTFSFEDKSLYNAEADIDCSASCFYNLHLLILNKLKEDVDPLEYFTDSLCVLQDKILIFSDISQGIVPTDRLMRDYREACGRVITMLSRKADSVYRVFFGIGQKIK